MTQEVFITNLRAVCSAHVERENGNLAMVYGDLLECMQTLVYPIVYDDTEYFVGIRPFGFVLSRTQSDLTEKLSIYPSESVLIYRIKVSNKYYRLNHYEFKYISTHKKSLR